MKGINSKALALGQQFEDIYITITVFKQFRFQGLNDRPETTKRPFRAFFNSVLKVVANAIKALLSTNLLTLFLQRYNRQQIALVR